MNTAAAGLYRAVVVDNKDPENRGRVKCQIFGLHTGETKLDALPWIEPFQLIGGNPSISTTYKMPLKTTCYVSFINGQIEAPVIVGYYRQSLKQVRQDLDKYDDTKDNACFYMALGNKATSPVLKFDSISEQITIGTQNNVHVLGASSSMHADKGVTFMSLKNTYTNWGYLTSPLNFSGVANLANMGISLNTMTPTGMQESTSGDKLTKILKKRTTNIGGGPKNQAEILSDALGATAMINDLGNFFKNSSPGYPASILGEDITNVLSNMAKTNNVNPIKKVAENVAVFLKKSGGTSVKTSLANILKSVKSESREFIGNFIGKQKASAKSILSLVKSLPDQIKGNLKNVPSTGLVDEENIYGTQRGRVFGNYTKIVIRNSSQTVQGSDRRTFGANMTWTIQNGNWNISSSRGSIKYTLSPVGILSIQQVGASLQDNLVKKIAFTQLVNIVNSLITWASLHLHPTAPPGPPSPPVIPPIGPIAQMGVLQTQVAILAPISPSFTNNLKSS